jgi:hypothetical protein
MTFLTILRSSSFLFNTPMTSIASPLLGVLVVAASLAVTPMVFGATIVGDVEFAGTAVLNGPLATATAFTSFVGVEVSDGTGSYEAPTLVSDSTSVTVTAFSFGSGSYSMTPVSPVVDPLWTFSVGGTTYSFKLSAMSVSRPVLSSTQFLNISGQGVASITGYDNTVATFAFTSSQSIGSPSVSTTFSLTSTAINSTVPEPGALSLLGVVLLGLVGWRRRSSW